MKYNVSFELELKKHNLPGTFIALEGLDASGKSTQVEKLKEALEQKGKTVIIKTPFEGEIGAFVRKVLAGEKKLDPIAMQYLINANRQEQQAGILKELEQGHIVINDRYFWSALAYAIIDRGMNFSEGNILEVALSILSMYYQFTVPDFTFFLHISVDEAIKRLDQMSKQKEIYEEPEQLQKVYDAYEWVNNQFSDAITHINGEQPVEKVTADMLQILNQKL